MDFLDPKKKRSNEIRLFLGYALVGIMLLLTTVILVFLASGYGVDRKTGTVIQNGLLFLDSHPESAQIYLNGKEKGQTDARHVLPVGSYDIELRREGYRSWRQQLNIEGSTIERLVYPFMVPQNLQTKDLKVYESTQSLVTASPDRRWMIAQAPASLVAFDVIDLGNKTNPIKPITLPATLFTSAGSDHKLELVEWSNDNRHVLVKHVFSGGIEFAIIDRVEPETSLNLTQLYGAAVTNIRLQDKKPDKLYLYTAQGGILQSVDTQSGVVTPLLTSVLAFQPHGDNMILYATSEGMPADKVSVRLRENLNTFNIRELPVSPIYLLEMARFEGSWYVALGATSENKVYIYKNPLDDLKKVPAKKPLSSSALRVDGAQYLSFSANARFISLQGGNKFAVYDAEYAKLYRYEAPVSLPANFKSTWMDGHRLILNNNGRMSIMDFNGTNLQELVETTPNNIPAFDRDYNALFTVQSRGNSSALQRTEMRLEPR